MGSRAVVVVCRDVETARRRFGVTEAAAGGIVYTRTGRRFFDDPAFEASLLGRLRVALEMVRRRVPRCRRRRLRCRLPWRAAWMPSSC